MGRKYSYIMCLFAVAFFLLFLPGRSSAQSVKMSIFNFQTLNLEASGYGTTATNLLTNLFMAEPVFALLDRKELEAFLSLNDLQQNDDLGNVVNIGNRLGLDVIVVGTVEKKGAVLAIVCKVIHIEQKKVVFTQQVRSLGDARMDSEINALGKAIRAAIIANLAKQKEKAAFKGPIRVQKRPGNRRIQLTWEDAPDTACVSYEVFRATSESGPFARVTQVSRPEFLDQNLENNIVYYYRIKAYDDKGLPSEVSDLISAETALTPNPPVILKAESHIKNIQITGTPSPISSNDPLKLMGYKLYRAKDEKVPYREVANISGRDLAVGVDTATVLDKLFKVTYTDSGLADGETFYYKLTSYNEKNLESDFSSAVKGSALPSVSAPEAQGDVREIVLSWTPVDSPYIKGYYAYRSLTADGGFAKIKKIDVTDGSQGKKIYYKDVDGLADSVRYFYRITAFESPNLETSYSVAASALTKGKPPAPAGLTVTNGLVKMVELKWPALLDEEVAGYKIYSSRSRDGEYVLIKKLEGRNNSKYLDEGMVGARLDDNATYYYTLTSYNRVDVESSSVRAFATTKSRPSKPAGLKVEDMKVKESPLSWQPNPESDIVSYHVFRNDNHESNKFTRIAKVEGKTAYIDKGLKDGATYLYALQAEDRDGLLSDLSESVTVKTKPCPKNPTRVSVEVQSGNVYLKWAPNTEPDISYYTIYEKRFFGLEKVNTVSGNESKFSETAPTKGKTKTYVITATDRDGLESGPSKEIAVTGK